jgi:hypothetical protein
MENINNQNIIIRFLKKIFDKISGTLTIGGSVIANQGTAGSGAWPVKISQSGTDNNVQVSAIPAITGSVTANAGTNLNTSALALESGGNLAATATSLTVIDDWDEGDRAKVNPIVGQTGVQGGAGASSANTQRMAIASDANTVDTELPAAAALNDTMGNLTTPSIGAAKLVWDGTNYVRAKAASQTSDTTVGIPAHALYAVFDDVSTQSITENKFGAVRMSSRKALLIEGVANGTDVNVKASANTGVDIGDVSINEPLSSGRVITAPHANNSGTPVDTTIYNATQSVSVVGIGAFTSGAGALQTNGSIAHDSVDAGNPNKIGGYASSAVPTAVSAAADRVNAWFDLNGRQVITMNSATSTPSNVSASASNVTVLAANTGRKGAMVYNDSTSILYLKYGATASATSFTVKMFPDDYHEVPFGYTGIIDGIWVAAAGAARVTELT